MNERLRSTLKYTAVFILGLLVGAFLLETLEIYLRPAYRDIVCRKAMAVCTRVNPPQDN